MVQQGEACLTATAGLVATGAGEPFGFKVSRLLLSLKVILLNVTTELNSVKDACRVRSALRLCKYIY